MATKIVGVEGLTVGQVQQEVANGAKFVVFSYVVSVLVMTFKRPTDIHYVRPGQSTFGMAIPWVLLSMVAGWWGIPFGFIYTPWSIIENLSGGKDVTAQVLAALGAPAAARPAAPAAATGTTGAPLTPR